MPTCDKCGSQAAYWAIIDKKDHIKEYCDNCLKEDDLVKDKEEMDEYRRRKKDEPQEIMVSTAPS